MRVRACRVRTVMGGAVGCLLFLGAAGAHAGTVVGTIEHDPGRLEAPERNRGFVPRIENPLRPVKKLDPRPWLIVVLEGGPVADADTTPPDDPVRYELVGESFQSRVLPVVAGSRVELKNRGYRAAVLYTPDAPELVDSVTLERHGTHIFQIGEPMRPIAVRSQISPHLKGTVVAFPHRYFSLVDSRGRFEIPNVPPGEWKLRVWYRDGWVKSVEETVQVGKRSTLTVTIPPKPEVERPNGSQ